MAGLLEAAEGFADFLFDAVALGGVAPGGLFDFCIGTGDLSLVAIEDWNFDLASRGASGFERASGWLHAEDAIDQAQDAGSLPFGPPGGGFDGQFGGAKIGTSAVRGDDEGSFGQIGGGETGAAGGNVGGLLTDAEECS